MKGVTMTQPPHSKPAQQPAEKPPTSTPPSENRRSRAGQLLKEVIYPHDIHPALVPGVSVEDQKIRYGLDKPLFAIVGLLIVGFVIWGVVNPDQVLAYSTAALTWVMTNLGWVFTSLAAGLAVVLLLIAFSRYGRIPLGLDGEKPEFSTASWAAMLFGAGIGIGIIFFGPYEPLTYYLSPRPGAYDPATAEAITGAMAQSALHWGINAWAIYAVVGLAVAYVSYRRGRVPLMSAILEPLFGNKTGSLGSRLIDGLAIVATLFGTAASLGIGALQIAHGTQLVTGWSTTGNTLAIIIIMLLTIGTIISAVSGVSKGIRLLSNINMGLAVGLALFIFIVGPTAFLLNIIPATLIEYVGTMPDALSANMAESAEMQAFLSAWTTFYWAWWVSWAPFVGVFVAKISRGRTIRQFVLGVLFIPSTIIVLAFTILGGTTIWLQRESNAIAPDGTAATIPPAQEIFFVVLDQLPGSQFIAPLIIVMLAIFFITTADSASLVNSQLSQRGNPNPKRAVTAFWALCMAGIAVVILLTGSENALQGLQNLITITALPFAVVLVLICVSFLKELRTDPMVIRQQFARAAVENAVHQGVHDYGDNFALTVEPTDPSSEYATGADFDSAAPEVTDWYIRRDEEGNEVSYDYALGEYTDEIPVVEAPEDAPWLEKNQGSKQSKPDAGAS